MALIAPTPAPTPSWLMPSAGADLSTSPAPTGWASLLFPNTGFSSFINSNQNALRGLGAGLASGQNISDGLANAVQGAVAGAPADVAAQKALDATNVSVDFLNAHNMPDLAKLAKAGQAQAALTQAFQRLQPGYGQQTVHQGDTILGPDNQPIYSVPQMPSAASLPTGYRPGPNDAGGNPTLVPISGGPADPNTTQMLSPDALDLVATQFLAGDRSAAVGYARNPALKAQITNAIAAKAKQMGMDGKAVAAQISAFGGNVAAQRAAGTRAAQVGMAASEASTMADIALEASKAVPRGGLTPWNSLTQAVATGTSSPEMAKFVTATTSLVNAYARAVSPLGAPTDAMRAHAEQMLNTAQGPDAYAAVISQMKQEMQAALNAPAEVSDSLKKNITGEPADTGDPAVDDIVNQVLSGQ